MIFLEKKYCQILFISFFLFFINLNAEIPKSSFCFKLYSGISFSRSTLIEDYSIENKNILSISPEFSYNYLFKNKDLLEIGITNFMIGNSLITGGPFTNIHRSLPIMIPITFHKKIGKKSNGMYVSLGAMVTYCHPGGVYVYVIRDSFSTIKTISNLVGFKLNLSIGLRYTFKIKRRNLGVELKYIQGLTNIYETTYINNLDLSRNTYVNKGSVANFGLVYFFGRDKV